MVSLYNTLNIILKLLELKKNYSRMKISMKWFLTQQTYSKHNLEIILSQANKILCVCVCVCVTDDIVHLFILPIKHSCIYTFINIECPFTSKHYAWYPNLIAIILRINK